MHPSAPQPDRKRAWYRLSRSAWLVVAGAFAAGLLAFALFWLVSRARAPVTAEDAPPEPAASTTSDSRPALPIPAVDDAAGVDQEADLDAEPGWTVDQPLEAPTVAQPNPESAPASDSSGNPAIDASTGSSSAPASIPVAVSSPPPRYPRSALRRGESGEVLLDVIVGANGRPLRVEVERSSRVPALDAAAVEAVRRWRFQPAQRQGEPVPARVRIPVTFNPD